MAGYIVGGILMILAGIGLGVGISLWAKMVGDRLGPQALRSAKVIAFLVIFWLGGLGLAGGGVWLFTRA